ncbi:MAG TPA: hypothetical protein DD400_01265 [Rhodospirillaceae bacterium]|nr:hypothetical protein [Rhodospirillaceae bacterium]
MTVERDGITRFLPRKLTVKTKRFFNHLFQIKLRFNTLARNFGYGGGGGDGSVSGNYRGGAGAKGVAIIYWDQ